MVGRLSQIGFAQTMAASIDPETAIPQINPIKVRNRLAKIDVTRPAMIQVCITRTSEHSRLTRRQGHGG